MNDQNSKGQTMKSYILETMKVYANKSGWKLFDSITKANISFSLFASSRTKTRKEVKAYKNLLIKLREIHIHDESKFIYPNRAHVYCPFFGAFL